MTLWWTVPRSPRQRPRWIVWKTFDVRTWTRQLQWALYRDLRRTAAKTTTWVELESISQQEEVHP